MHNDFSDLKGKIQPFENILIKDIFRKMDEAEVAYSKWQEVKEEASISE